MNRSFTIGTVFAKAVAITLLASGILAAEETPRPLFPLPAPVVSTIPSNGDVNPYGVAYVPRGVPQNGTLKPGDTLISNFNDKNNLQGLGTTITRVDRAGKTSTFFTSSNGRTGLTAALGVLTNGFVLIGNLPTLDGTAATVRPGNLSVTDSDGNLLGTIGTIETINGPWGMAVFDLGRDGSGKARIFVSNVLSGVISRFDITYSPVGLSASVTIIATGFNHRLDPAAIVLGPSGLAFDAERDTLFVASSADNAIYEIHDAASTSHAVTPNVFVQDLAHLHGPLDIALLPNRHLLVANSDGSNVDPNQPSELVEYSAEGKFVSQMPIDPNNGGAFGLAIGAIDEDVLRLSAVDDNANSLTTYTVRLERERH